MLLYVFQDKLLYFPSMPPNSRTAFVSPHHFGLQNVRYMAGLHRLLAIADLRCAMASSAFRSSRRSSSPRRTDSGFRCVPGLLASSHALSSAAECTCVVHASGRIVGLLRAQHARQSHELGAHATLLPWERRQYAPHASTFLKPKAAGSLLTHRTQRRSQLPLAQCQAPRGYCGHQRAHRLLQRVCVLAAVYVAS